jgi:hypothetical protein
LGVKSPWVLKDKMFNTAIDAYIEYERGSKLNTMVAVQVHDGNKTYTDLFDWSLLFTKVPRIRCTKDGVKLLILPWDRRGNHYSLKFGGFNY